MDVIADAPEPFAMADLARRPTPSSLDTYRRRLDLPASSRSVQHGADLDDQLLIDVLAAAYVPSNEPVVVTQNLAEAERALAAAWRLQWPALRKQFSFRTRDTVRDSKRADVTVARRLKGPTRHRPTLARPEWVSELGTELQSRSPEQPLSRFLWEFGEFETAEPGAVARLATIYTTMRTGTAEEIRDAVAEAYPTRAEGQQLKRVLFGGDVPDEDRRRSMLVALLGSGTDGWDAFQLHLPERIAALIAEIGAESFGAVLAPTAGAGIREAVSLALVQRNDPSDVAVLSGTHLDLVLDVVRNTPALMNSKDAWRGTSDKAASRLLATLDRPSPAAIIGAVAAGGADIVTSHVDVHTALAAVATADFATAMKFAKTVQWPTLVEAAKADQRVALLAAAATGRHQLPESVLSALEARRMEPNELWLRAAVAAIAAPSLPARQVLPIVFGPLHEAMTSDRLPHECWGTLDALLPPSPDPAQRLRRYLVAEARREQWSETEFRRAIADSGPFASQLQFDFTDQGDEWYVAVAKAVLRAVGILGR